MTAGMSTRFKAEQHEFAAAVRDFCRRECTGEQLHKLTHGGLEAHSPELYERLAATGYAAVSIPEEYGGSGGGLIEQVLLFEELSYGLAPVHGAGSSHMVAAVYKHFGSEAQKNSALRAVASGEVMSISISEPEAGSDAANISCRATPVPGGYRISGQKTWCSDAQLATRILVVVRTERSDSRHHGLTMLEVPANSDGLTIRPIDTMAPADDRRPPRLHQGAPPVRQAHRELPGRSASGRGPGDRDRISPRAHLRRGHPHREGDRRTG